jgi:hypothetical protein
MGSPLPRSAAFTPLHDSQPPLAFRNLKRTQVRAPADLRSRSALTAINCFAALCFLAVAFAYAYYVIFSRKLADDEGYLMISVKGFLEGHPLYNSVFTQYGPFYYFYEWLMHGVLGIPLTHDATRLLCIGHWLLAAVALGVAGGLLTHSKLAGFFVFVQATVHLTGIANEPGHPQELVALLLALAVVFVAGRDVPMRSARALALIGAVLVLTKVNVGAFFCISLGLAILCQTQGAGLLSRRELLAGVLSLCASMPFLLMRRHLAEPWCRNYAILTALSVTLSAAVARSISSKAALNLRELGRMGLWLIGPGLIAVGILMFQGTTLRGLLEGLVVIPMKMPTVALLPIGVPDYAVLNAALSGMAAVAFLAARDQSFTRRCVLFLKGLCGLLGSLWLIADPNAQLVLLLPWTWLVLVPSQSEGEATSPSDQLLPRIFLCLAASWQGLQAYPIGGTQVTLATFLLVLVYTLCLSDSLRELAASRTFQALQRLLPNCHPSLAHGLATALLLYGFAMIWCKPHLWARYYARLTPLQLRGSERIRLEPDAVQLYRSLMQYIEANCDTFATYPGFNSFYFWTGKQPPTQLNSTGWGQLTAQQQAQILDALCRANQPLLVVHENVSRNWAQEIPPPIETLVHFVLGRCRQIHRIGPYIIYRPVERRVSVG